MNLARHLFFDGIWLFIAAACFEASMHASQAELGLTTLMLLVGGIFSISMVVGPWTAFLGTTSGFLSAHLLTRLTRHEYWKAPTLAEIYRHFFQGEALNLRKPLNPGS
ncbi:MAG: hypothetical protein HQ488_01245 [Parcubacteria group bacterium]|nr:hypothetical protein [Parcubacteria group bacterium]